MRNRLLLAAWALTASAAIAQEAPRLSRPVPFPESGEVPADATIGQVVVDYYDRLQSKHADALPAMDDAFTCRSATAKLLQYAATQAAQKPGAPDKAQLKAHDAAALSALATEAVAQLDGVDAARIRADEALSPGVYHNSIAAVTYTIDRCRFY